MSDITNGAELPPNIDVLSHMVFSELAGMIGTQVVDELINRATVDGGEGVFLTDEKYGYSITVANGEPQRVNFRFFNFGPYSIEVDDAKLVLQTLNTITDLKSDLKED